MALFLGGCDIMRSDSDADPETDRTLDPGETALPLEDVHLMASPGAIDTSVSVSAQEVPDPTAETPLPESISEAGAFYRVSGDRNVDLSSQEPPLYLALPVPDNADPAHLALGIRIPGSYVTDPSDDSPEFGWDLVRGAYEPERNLLVVPMRFLVSEGIVFSVVQHPDYASPSMEGTSGETLFEKTKNFFSQEATLNKAGKKNAYKVKCKGFSGNACGSNEKDAVRQYLKEAYRDFVSDFREPDLRSPLFSDKYVWIIKKKGKAWCKGSTVGKYLSLTNKAITCYDGNGTPSEGTTRHEFFHAIQYNYAPISWSKLPKQRPDWVIEGTAELAADPNTAGSKQAIRDSGRNLRVVDVPLPAEDNNSQYEAQDFWTHLINSRSSTLAHILDPVFKQQSNAPNKPTAEKVDKLYGLDDAYWDWVRNQAFESHLTSGYGGALNAACIFNDNVASPMTVTYDAGTRSNPKEEFTVVPRLSAQVVEVNVQTGASRIDLEISASTSDPKSYVKAYPNYSAPTTDCWGGAQSASDSLTDIVKENAQKTYYVLLAATTIDVQRSAFSIEISHEDRLTK